MQNDLNNRQPTKPMPPNMQNRRQQDSMRRTQGVPVQSRQPARPPQNAGRRPDARMRQPQGAPRAGRPSAAVKTPPNPNMKRNFRLFAVLLLLITVCVIIFGVQSCTRKDKDSNKGGARDSVQLNTPQAGDNPSSAVPVLAQYTDDSKTLSIDSSYGVLIDLDKNEIIASKKADDKIYPASMTKVMTLIVAMENISDLEDTFTFTSAMLDPLYVQNASMAGFSPGETAPLKDIIYGCILPSGADCTTALATYVAGSEEEFAKMMNEKAAELGLENTHFVTASGLHDDDHYTTCREMAVIMEYAVKNEDMRKVLSTYKYTTSPTNKHPNGITVTSTLFSRMSGDEADGVFVQGGKTGYTLEGKNCLATFAANCTESEAQLVRPQYLLITAYASGEYTPVHDAINTYKKYCSGN